MVSYPFSLINGEKLRVFISPNISDGLNFVTCEQTLIIATTLKTIKGPLQSI